MTQLCKIFNMFGFIINWNPNKTECFIRLRGKGSISCMSEIVKSNWNIALPEAPGSPKFRIVQEYKHLGSWLDNTGRSGRDVGHRTSSAMTAYVPLSYKVFGIMRIQCDVRLSLFMSLVVSRLVHNVHTWSALTASAYQRLNSVYMRGLRRIAGACNFGQSGACTNVQVRQSLNAPSLQCIIIRRRLQLFASLVTNGPEHLLALLSCSRAGSALPWVRTIVSDLCLLQQHLSPRLDDLGDPRSNADQWHRFIIRWPHIWSQYVEVLHITSMGMDRQLNCVPMCSHIAKAEDLHVCHVCNRSFHSNKALMSHQRACHGVLSTMLPLISESLRCPVCLTKFSTHASILAPLNEKRLRGKRIINCHLVIKSGIVRPSDDWKCQKTRRAARSERSAARKRGLSQPPVLNAAKRPKFSWSLAHAAATARRAAEAIEDMPDNSFDWTSVRPTKRLRAKASPDSLLAQIVARCD